MGTFGTALQSFLSWLLETTLVASVVICLILVLQKLLGHRLGPRWSHALWLVLLLRMVLPWTPPSPISLFSLIPTSHQRSAVREIVDSIPREHALPPAGNERTMEGTTTTTPTPGESPAEPAGPRPHEIVRTASPSAPLLGSVRRMLPVFWLAGAILIGGYVAASNFSLWRIIKREHPLVQQPILELFEQCKAQMGVEAIVALVPSDQVRTAALFGFVRPRLLLPREMIDTASPEELRYIFLHELAHLKRHDIYLGWLTSLLQVLHWFNPLVWFAFYRMRSDRELACDALVLTRTRAEESHDYGRTMVGLLGRFSCARPLPAMAGILESKAQVKRRVAMITQFKKNSYRWSPLAVVLMVVLTCVSLPDAKRTKASQTPASQSTPHVTLRQVWSGSEVDTYGSPSSDGRYLSYTDWETGDLAIRELATGKTRRLTEGRVGGKEKHFRFALNSVISPDNKHVAYSWTNKHGTYDLCLIGIDGSGARTLYSDKNHELYPACWSSDGKRILARKYKTFGAKDGKSEVVAFSAESGAIESLKIAEKGPMWRRPCYSPDDEFIAYQLSVEADSGNFDIGLFDTKTRAEHPLVEHPANDRLLGWVPNRQEILFLSDRAGSHDIWAMRVVDGKAEGPPKPITRDIGQITPQGFTQDGSLYFNRYTRSFTTRMAPFDADTGNIQIEAGRTVLGSYFSAEWSPDGDYVAYVEEKTAPAGPGYYHRPLNIRNLRTGKSLELAGHIEVRAPHWSPDGRSILVTGFDTNRRTEKDYTGGLYTIDVADGQVTQLVQYPADRYWWNRFTAQWSSDGRAIYYRTANGISMRELKSGQEKLLYENENLGRALKLSPDGEALVFAEEMRDEGKANVLTIQISGGKPTTICRFEESKAGIQVPRGVTWTPDGNYVVFAKNERKGSTVWRVSRNGGDPERIWTSRDRVTNLSFRPDGKEIALSTYIQEQVIWVMENFLPTMVASEPSNQPKFTRIRIPTGTSWDMRLSPDGQRVSLVSDEKLWIMPLAGQLGPDIPGRPVELDTEDVSVEWTGHTWSGDGKWIAFNESPPNELNEENKGNQSIYIVSTEGGKPTKVYENYRDERTVNYRISLSPAGKTLAFSSVDLARKEQHIYTIPVDGGSPRQLVDAQAREPVFSPDGKMIAFVEDRNLGRGGGGLWVVPAQGGTPKHVADAVNASSPVWSPNGDMIAFLDYGKRRNQINFIPIGENGEAAGDLITIGAPAGIDGIWLLAGWSPDNRIGAIFERRGETGLYTLPAKGGKAMQVARGGGQPRWSPDGERIFIVAGARRRRSAWQRLAIASIPAEGGSVTTVPIQSEARIHIPAFGVGNRVSPDGKTIVFSGRTQSDPVPFLRNHIWTVPVAGGKPKQITQVSEQTTDMFPCWSPDGKAIAFVRTRIPAKIGDVDDYDANIYIVQATGGEPTLLTTEPDNVSFGPIEWSPDGQFIAYFSQEGDASSSGNLRIMSANGDGKSRVIGEVRDPHPGVQFAWSPDSKRIAFSGPDGKVIRTISIEDGSTVNIKTGLVDSNIGGRLDWSPDGERFVFVAGAGERNEFWVMEDFLPETTVAKPEPMTTVRRIGGDWGTFASLSPDGRYLCDVDWGVEALAVLELATGKVRHLTGKSPGDASYPLESAISPDSKEVAYLWWDPNTKASSLHVVGLDGSGDRLLCEGKYPMPRAWSADGQKILAVVSENDVQQMVWVSASDGSMEHIASFPGESLGYPGKFDIAPDGRFIAYDRPQTEDASKRDIVVFDLAESVEVSLVEHPADDRLLGWTPDGRQVLFASDRAGSWDAWLLKVPDGKPSRFPVLTKHGVGNVRPIGFTPNGSYYYAHERILEDVLTARLDLETGKVLSEPVPVCQTGATVSHDWSPDGRYLAYCTQRPDESWVIHIRTLATGRERTLADNLPFIRWLRWSLDGRSILIDNAKRGDSQGVIFKIDVQTGARSDLARSETEMLVRPEMSLDGKTLYYDRNDPKSRTMRLMARDLESGREKELIRIDPPARLTGSALSPDGQRFVLSIVPNRAGTDGPVLKVLSTAGGPPTELLHLKKSENVLAVGVTWMPDSRDVLFWKWFPGDKEGELWRISAEGGEARRLWSRKTLGHMRVHPDGERIAFYDRSTTRGIWVMENFLSQQAGK